jgi:hypothetical protein
MRKHLAVLALPLEGMKALHAAAAICTLCV